MTPWQRIIRAAKRSTGVRLTAIDCLRLSRDDAIMTRAEADNDGETGEDRECCDTKSSEAHLPGCEDQ